LGRSAKASTIELTQPGLRFSQSTDDIGHARYPLEALAQSLEPILCRQRDLELRDQDLGVDQLINERERGPGVDRRSCSMSPDAVSDGASHRAKGLAPVPGIR